MPRLIHLNGPPGIGKSTLARMYIDEHVGVLNLDVDQLRTLIGGWQERFSETGETVRSMALVMAGVHLRTGDDVVLPQYLGRLSEIQRFEAVAHESDAAFCEVVLMDSKKRSVERFTRRGDNHAPTWHREVLEIVAQSGGPALLADMHDRLVDVVRAWPNAIVVPSVAGAIQQTYEAFSAVLDPGCAGQ